MRNFYVALTVFRHHVVACEEQGEEKVYNAKHFSSGVFAQADDP